MTIFGIILGLVALVVAGVLVAAALRPNRMSIARTADIAAPPHAVYALIEDFRQWSHWSPWDKMDPTMTRTYGGPPSGKGATYAWSGDKKVGEGRMEITDTAAPSRVNILLQFIRPFPNTADVVFSLTDEGQATRVVWSMDSPAPFMSKLMGLFINMDALIGKDFEAGLRDMKALAETSI